MIKIKEIEFKLPKWKWWQHLVAIVTHNLRP